MVARELGNSLGNPLARARAANACVASQAYNTVAYFPEPYINSQTISGGVGRISAIELDNGDYLSALTTSAANTSCQRFRIGISGTSKLRTVTTQSTANITVSSPGASLLCRVSSSKVLFVTRTGTFLSGLILGVSNPASTTQSAMVATAASGHMPLSVIHIGEDLALVLTFGGGALNLWRVDCSGATPVFTACTLAGTGWLNTNSTDDTGDHVRFFKLTDSTFIIQSIGSGALTGTSVAQGVSLSGTTATRSNLLTLQTNDPSNTAVTAICRASPTTAIAYVREIFSGSNAGYIKMISYDGSTLSLLSTLTVHTTGTFAISLNSGLAQHMLPFAGGYFVLFGSNGTTYSHTLFRVVNGAPEMITEELRTAATSSGSYTPTSFYPAVPLPSNAESKKSYMIFNVLSSSFPIASLLYAAAVPV